MDQFEKLFGFPVAKRYAGKLEYRGIKNLDKVIDKAKEIIANNKLNLTIVHDGSLAQIGAFIVETRAE